MSTLKVGDVVRLKSGGPAMTVTHLDEQGRATVSYFSGGEVQAWAFPPDALVDARADTASYSAPPQKDEPAGVSREW